MKAARKCGDRVWFMPHLRISEAAALLGVSDDTVRRMVDDSILLYGRETE